MAKHYQAVVRKRGETEWKNVTYSGQEFFSDSAGASNLQQMTQMMAASFPQNEYQLREVDL